MRHTVTRSRVTGHWIVDALTIGARGFRRWADAMAEANTRARRDCARTMRMLRALRATR